MKKLFVITAFVMLTSCVKEGSRETPNRSDNESKSSFIGSTEYIINEKTIDSCQYIIVSGVEAQAIVHKPNCRNTFHSDVK